MSKIRYIKDNEWENFPNFRKEEFRCPKHCNGYPSEIAYSLIELMQTLRNRYGVPIHVNSGVRCQTYNDELKGSSAESDHRLGMACDFNFENNMFSYEQKEGIMSYIRTLPNCKYTYSNQTNMFNGIHVSVKPTYEEEIKVLAPNPLEQNKAVNQVKVLANSTIYCRLSPDKTIENKVSNNFVKVGYYNILSETNGQGYHWYEIEKDRWIAQVEGYVEYIPKYLEPVIENKPIEEEKGQVSPIIPSEPETLENEPKNGFKSIIKYIIEKILEYLKERYNK